MYNFSEQNIFIFLLQVFLLLGLAKWLGEIFRKLKQPALTAEILAGVILGPTIFGRFLPLLYQTVFPADILQQNMLETVAWLGLLFFLLETGLKMDFSSAWRHRGDALTIAITDIVVPMAIAFCLAFFIPAGLLVDPNRRIIFALFMATVMTVSAMPITIRALNDLNLSKTDLGFLIMSALSVNEVIGWMIFTLILSFFSQVNIDIAGTALLFFITIGFIIFCLSLGRKFANTAITKIKENNMPEPGSSLTFVALLGILCGAIFQRFGINALLGFFIAGVMVGEATALKERTRQVISQMVYAIFVPLFFAGIGLRVDFFKGFNIFLVLFVCVIAVFGKFFGAWLGVTFTRLSRSNRLSIAIAHTPGGSMEIVIGILALQHNLITEPVFVAIVFGAVLSSLAVGPWLKYSITRRKEIGILEFFSRRSILPDLKSEDRDDIIRELCLVAAEEGNMPDAETLYSAVLEREDIMGTAIEEGIAIPHARLAGLIRPTVIFGVSRFGAEWNSPDGKPTHFIFLILTPQNDDEVQIQILRIIAKTMANSRIRDEIMTARDSQGIWEIIQNALTFHHIVRNNSAR